MNAREEKGLVGLAIHFHKQLVQRILLFALTTKVSPPPRPANSVDLVDEQDAWSVLPRQHEHVTHLTYASTCRCTQARTHEQKQ